MSFLEEYIILSLLIYALDKLFGILPKNVLSCGIFGGSAKEGKTLNLRKLMALGLYNIQRGTDSCGYYYNGYVQKGIDRQANFGNFISKNKIIKGELPCEVFIGHTRKSTSGVNSVENAHPHIVNNYIQTHNGVLRNIWTLCNENNIKHTNIHVDSMGLAHIIEKDRSFDILNKYDGYAALAMTWMDNPNSLFLYHGATKETHYGGVFEERPLFTLDTPEGIYYSSMEESLTFINESKKIKPEILPHNIVYEIRYGKIVDNTIKIDRHESNLKPIVVHTPPIKKNITQQGVLKEIDFGTNVNATTFEDLSVDSNEDRPIIYKEGYPEEYATQDLYYRRGRFYKKLNTLLHGVYEIDRDGIFILNNKTSTRVSETYYFYRGVMIKNEKEYNKLLIEYPNPLNGLELNVAYNLSEYSKYPICCIENEGLHVSSKFKRVWYKDDARVSTSFKPKFSNRTYCIKEGLLHSAKNTKFDEVIFTKTEDDTFYSVLDNNLILNKELEKEVMYDMLLELINIWANKILTFDDLLNIPEPFLLIIDEFNLSYHENNAVSDKELESETSSVLKDLFKLEISFLDYLNKGDEQRIITLKNIKTIFSAYEYDEIFDLTNRYAFISLDDDDDLIDESPLDASLMAASCEFKPENKIAIYSEKPKLSGENKKIILENTILNLKDQLTTIVKKADNYQAIDKMKAQTMAWKLYQEATIIENKIKEKERDLAEQERINEDLPF